LTPHQSQYYAWLLTRRAAGDTVESLASTLVDSQVDLNPHQVEAALFACSNPLSRGVVLADEVGLGKTIEAGLVISQRWAERRRSILIIVPANLRKQWHQELQDKFSLQSLILEAKNYNSTTKTLKEALAHFHSKVLLTATPLQNSLLELYGLVSMIDDRVFGDIDSFRSQFTAQPREQAFAALRTRLGPVYKRTLRRQVQQYVPYTARRVIYVTTQNLSAEQLQALSDEVGSDQSLLVCCAAFHGVTAAKASERWPNLTLKKIPKMVLARCAWGHDDYSLNVANLPMAKPEPAVKVPARDARGNAQILDLFGGTGGEVAQ
jgi:SNF2 family DNA or RNA helicase